MLELVSRIVVDNFFQKTFNLESSWNALIVSVLQYSPCRRREP